MTLPSQDSAVGRGVKTAIQAAGGLVLAVWAVPGVPAVVTNYVHTNVLQALLTVGLPAGIVALVWNLLRSEVPNW